MRFRVPVKIKGIGGKQVSKPIEYEKFKQLKQNQLSGMASTAIAEKLGVSTNAVRNWWGVDEDSYKALSKSDEYELDNAAPIRGSNYGGIISYFEPVFFLRCYTGRQPEKAKVRR